MSIIESLDVVLSIIASCAICTLVTYTILEYPWGKIGAFSLLPALLPSL